MSEQATERLSHGRDASGRLLEWKILELAQLCKKTLDAMAKKGAAASDNYFFFQDMWFMCMQAFELTEQNEALARHYHLEKQMNEVIITKNIELEREISAYRTIENNVRFGSMDELVKRVEKKIKMTEALKDVKKVAND